MITENTNDRAVYFGVPWGGRLRLPAGGTGRPHDSSVGAAPHDMDGKLIAPAPLDADGYPSDFSNMEEQMRATYANAVKVLAQFGATLDDAVQETLFVLDMPAASRSRARRARRPMETHRPQVASNIIGVKSLANPEQLIEISFQGD